MLTRRTNVLFSEDDYMTLLTLSRRTKKTIGELVRLAVKKAFKKRLSSETQTAFREIRRLTKNMDFSDLDYKALINYGRKY